jgi:Fe-S-cluster containining protein
MKILSTQRRSPLLEKMKDLADQGFNCHGCKGHCCTYEANSMLITPIEAVELMIYLKNNHLLNDSLKERLTSTVSAYRLEPRPLVKKHYFRKTYTCPFYSHEELGCPLPPEIKPFGCLAFNSHHPSEKATSHCYSEIEVLEQRELNNLGEDQLNQKLREEFHLWWEKAPIPNALLELWNHPRVFDLELI